MPSGDRTKLLARLVLRCLLTSSFFCFVGQARGSGRGVACNCTCNATQVQWWCDPTDAATVLGLHLITCWAQQLAVVMSCHGSGSGVCLVLASGESLDSSLLLSLDRRWFGHRDDDLVAEQECLLCMCMTNTPTRVNNIHSCRTM